MEASSTKYLYWLSRLLGIFMGLLLPQAGYAQAVLENPRLGSFQSGVGIVSGFVCEAERVEIEFDGGVVFEAAYGTSREDTRGVCGDANNGFGLLFNWNLLGDGLHTVRALADGSEVGQAVVIVATLGGEFFVGLSGEFQLEGFPAGGATVRIIWQEGVQNFLLRGEGSGGSGSDGQAQAVLENPRVGSFQSGVGVVTGFVCEAERVEIEFDGRAVFEAAYGTSREDTRGVCGDANNGFGLLFNWNLLGDGLHTIRTLADGQAFADVSFQVTTLGLGEFAQGLRGAFTLADFLADGTDVRVEWQERLQNFTISGAIEPATDAAGVCTTESGLAVDRFGQVAMMMVTNPCLLSGGTLMGGLSPIEAQTSQSGGSAVLAKNGEGTFFLCAEDLIIEQGGVGLPVTQVVDRRSGVEVCGEVNVSDLPEFIILVGTGMEVDTAQPFTLVFGSAGDELQFGGGGGPLCGNNVRETGEVCDETDRGGADCSDMGLSGGSLRCQADCSGFDTSSCFQCGNGQIDSDEVCDGNNLGGATCQSQGFDGGTLACTPSCALDTAACTLCGNALVEPGEVCDGNNLGGASCEDFGFDGGTLICNADCRSFNTAGCATSSCGNGVINGTEACDGDDLGGATCESLEFDGGTLACTAGCAFDTAGCTVCGDGIVDPGEVCDGNDLGGATCEDFGFDGGTLICNADCGSFNTAGCATSSCGNGVINDGELCDGDDLGGATCESLGFDGGTLACTPSCVFDTSGCTVCGDGIVDPGEVCDGSDLGGASCEDFGFDGGTLICNADCGSFNTAGCATSSCGNLELDPGEACDGDNLGGATCESLEFDGGTLACTAGCAFDTAGCTVCGDGIVDPGEVCDGSDLGGASCENFGFDGGTLSCNADCSSFNPADCTASGCGNGIIEGGEMCDGGDLGGATCESLGFEGGTLACTASCDFDDSGCTNAATLSSKLGRDVMGREHVR